MGTAARAGGRAELWGAGGIGSGGRTGELAAVARGSCGRMSERAPERRLHERTRGTGEHLRRANERSDRLQRRQAAALRARPFEVSWTCVAAINPIEETSVQVRG